MSSVNTYLKRNEEDQKICLLLNIQRYFSFIMDCFGLEYGKTVDQGDKVGPLMDVFATYRDDVKKAAKNKDTSFKDILGLSDKVRDESLPEFGLG